VPFEEKDAAKALGARWDPEIRSWYAPSGVAIEPLARWIADLSDIPGPYQRVQLLGLPIQCWNCHATTVCVVGFMEESRRDSFYDMATADDDSRLSIATRLLGEDRQQHRVGSVRRRFSRTINDHQVANGCFHCDALQGNFFLFHEELPEAVTEMVSPVWSILGLTRCPPPSGG
jgi:hypothetical protein